MFFARLFLAVFLLSFCMPFVPAAHADTNVLFIVDASGSMKKLVDGKQRMVVAKKVLGETLSNMPKDAHLGLFVYGHRKAKDCTDMELVSPIGGEDAASIRKTITGLAPKGETPIADSLRQAAKSFNAFKGQQNSIILVTDGIEECKGDPCAAAQELKDAGLDVKVNIVGFTLSEQEGAALKCVSDITGGQYYSASNAAGLTDALKQVRQQVQETAVVQTAKPAPKSDDILAAKNGGTLIYAPNDKWSTINTDKFDGATYAGEAVWSFKDGKPGTFDRVEILVTQAYPYNLKDFEVLVGDESPTGQFRSLGEFTVLNAKVQPEGWQAFKFDSVTAKYLKLVFKTDQGGGYINGHRIRVPGKVDETVEAAAKPKLEGTDILASKNGGTLVIAPNDKWKTINTDKLEGATYAGEGVWSFKDGKPATFDRLEVQVTATYQYNLKDFEVFAGNDSPTGQFQSLGTFTIQNVKVMPDGWQSFSLPSTTAKFLKIVFKTDQGGGYINGHRISLYGKVDETAQAAAQPSKSGIDILSAKNGGTLVIAPNDKWQTINTDKFEGATYAGEGVWSFKDGKPATFDRLEVEVTAAYQYNLKDFEVFSGNDGPTGQFQSLGTFTVQNIKVMPDGWQSFALPSTTAKFVKINFKNDQGGGYINGHRISLYGKIDDSAAVAEKAAAIAGTNILQQSNGGMLLVSPNDEWTKLNDGKGDRATTYSGQGVWAFKGEKPATFEAIDVLVPFTDNYNLKEFEVLVGDEGPTGAFRSIGTFTAENIKVMPNGYQRFTFPKVKAKYIKFDFKTGWGSYIAAYELGVIGTVEE